MPLPGSATFPSVSVFPGQGAIRFSPPFIIRDHQIEGRLFGSLQFGITVMRIGGEWVEAEFPTWEQEQSADVLFRGGHVHPVDEVIADELTAAGYVVTEIDE